jgi:hypothetical protein
MRAKAQIPIRLLAVLAGSGFIACQGSNLTLPADLSPTSLEAVSGNGQQGQVGSRLPEPLVVRVRDAANQPVPDVELRFESQAPAVEIVPPIATTNDTGVAQVQVWLGSTEGVQTVEASLAPAGNLKTTFALIAISNSGDGDDRGGDRGRGGGKDDGGGKGNKDEGDGRGDDDD